mgnify:CR=1 FL=1
MKTILFVLVAMFASFNVSALDYTALAPGVIIDGDNPEYDFDYCDQERAKAGQCTLLQESDNGTWVTFRTSGGEQCEGGFYGYINTFTGKGYMIDSAFTCGHPNMELRILNAKAGGKYLMAVYINGQQLGTEPLL